MSVKLTSPFYSRKNINRGIFCKISHDENFAENYRVYFFQKNVGEKYFPAFFYAHFSSFSPRSTEKVGVGWENFALVFEA